MEKFIGTHPSELKEVMDVIFKWANIRLTESSNTKLLISLLDFFANLLQHLIDSGNQLEDFEIIILLGTLCDKAGINNKILIDKIRKLIKMCYEVYAQKEVFRIIIDYGVKCKNLKSVAENLDEVADYINKNGVDTVTKKDFALFLVCADNSDKGVRENSLKVFAEAYALLGEDVWRMLPKDVPIKVKGLLEARFKSVVKKAGGKANLAASINSNQIAPLKGVNPLDLTGSEAKKRNSVNPGSALGLTGLKFNKPPSEKASLDASMKDSEKETESAKITTKMKNFEIEDKEETKQPNL